MMRVAILGMALAALTGCGDVGRIVLDVQFPNEDVELQTRALEVIVRDAGNNQTPCTNPFDRGITGEAEDRRLIEYPNIVDTSVLNVDLATYSALNLRVYAFDGFDFEADRMVAGGCLREVTQPGVTTELSIALDPR